MKSEITIIPVILAETEEEYRDKLNKITQSPELSGCWVQIDIVDGKFAPNLTVGLDIIKKYPLPPKTEVHLMVQNPDGWIKALAKLGVKRIIFPIEVRNTEKLIAQIKSFGIEAGVGLNPETEVAKVTPFIDKMDLVLLLSVHPGFGGQEFIEGVLDKVKEIVRIRANSEKPLIEVDGGISADNARKVIEAGADNLVIGEHLINDNIAENLEKIWEEVTF